ncbi:MAG: ATP-binding protein [Candidatus Eisenbacteria bacterium]|nr:ATP-binding protein [Candidatus Eisenbacteria bacterium]
MSDFEKLGAFYLGRHYDLATGALGPELMMYDSRDLVTHGVIVGMTGSGKTGLALSLIEEAALDGVPTLLIDPKGDLGNLLLTFPDLQPANFAPWVDAGEAQRQALSVEEYAARMAETWRNGLAEWGEDGARIARLRDAAEFVIYTPGSSAGVPLAVLRSFAAPAAAVRDDVDAFRERISAAVSGLLALVGVEADPIRSREHILLSNLLDRAWREGRDMDIGTLIAEIQRPPFEKIGVMSLDAFFPDQDRFDLALQLNNLLASPGFRSWMEGEPLDPAKLFYTPAGKPRIAICSIAHLSDAERMFFVTLLLNELLAWMRAQSGTTSLRALLYMDEVFGYFPPSANPPCKQPMLTLLKQGRAFGLGVVLATQNPVDLDYKGLANAGTWWIGRLQTERDKMRVLEGLEGASATQGSGFDRGLMEATLAGLKSRVFLMNNVHDDAPTLFHTRWTLSYLRGPLTRSQIGTLMRDREGAATNRPRSTSGAAPGAPDTTGRAAGGTATRVGEGMAPGAGGARGISGSEAVAPIPSDIAILYLEPDGDAPLFPALYGAARVHYTSAKAGVDQWEDLVLLTPLSKVGPEPLLPAAVWENARVVWPGEAEFQAAPPLSARFGELPPDATKAKSYAAWTKALTDHLYRSSEVKLLQCPALKQISRPGETEGEFRVRLGQTLRERRDAALEKLRARQAPAIARLEERIRQAAARVAREEADVQQAQVSTAISIGSTVLGAIFGRKAVSGASARRAAGAMRGATRAGREKAQLEAAGDTLEALQLQREELEASLRAEVAGLDAGTDPLALELTELLVKPKKADIAVAQVALAWVPGSAIEPS